MAKSDTKGVGDAVYKNTKSTFSEVSRKMEELGKQLNTEAPINHKDPFEYENTERKKRSKMLSMFYALLWCLFYAALAVGTNILSHKLFGLYCGIDSITFSMVFTIVWLLCYIHITED